MIGFGDNKGEGVRLRALEDKEPEAREAASTTTLPEPEVVVQARRRHFSTAYKLRIVREADACRNSGDIGALLRREGLYSSHLSPWRRQRENGQLKPEGQGRGGGKGSPKNEVERELARVWRENRRLSKQLDLCSVRTMYRLLKAHDDVRERRRQLTHPVYNKPELLATGPNEVWRWDITKLRGPVKWRYFYLYVILDIFSRYVVGWMVAERESKELAMALVRESYDKQGGPGQLTIHADRGPAMKAKDLALLMADLGITKTHSRPYTGNDNPYSEAQFKTLKYRPGTRKGSGLSREPEPSVGPSFAGTTMSTATAG